jgi:hypothetical protein
MTTLDYLFNFSLTEKEYKMLKETQDEEARD